MSLNPAMNVQQVSVEVQADHDEMPNNDYKHLDDLDTAEDEQMEQVAFVEMAADSSSTIAFLKVLMVGVIAILKDGTINQNVKRIADVSYAPARGFEKTLDGSSMIAGVKAMITGAKSYDPDALLQQARAVRKSIRVTHGNTTTISSFALNLMLQGTTYLINQSEGSLRKIQKMLPALDEPALTAEFAGEDEDQNAYTKPLEKIVRAYGGKGISLNAEQREKLQTTKPAVYKEYLRLTKLSNLSWKTALKNMVFKSGRPYIDYQVALKGLKAAGYRFKLPEGFNGFIGPDLIPYTKYGKAINGNIGNMQEGTSIRMNPMYSEADDRYVFTIVKEDGSIQGHIYTKDYRASKTEVKFAKVDKLRKKLPSARKKWLAKLDGKITDGSTVLSTFLETIYETSARIGSVGNKTDGKDTFGLSTVQAGNCKIQGNQAVIAYSGKDGVAQKHIITGNNPITKKLVRNLTYLKAAKKPKDLLFTYLAGDHIVPLTAGKANQAFRKITGLDVTLHKLRHVRGTEIFEAQLAALDKKEGIFSHNPPTTPKQALEILKNLATKVGETLGHIRTVNGTATVTPLTALQNYIDPQVMMNFFTKLKLRPPALIEKLVKMDK